MICCDRQTLSYCSYIIFFCYTITITFSLPILLPVADKQYSVILIFIETVSIVLSVCLLVLISYLSLILYRQRTGILMTNHWMSGGAILVQNEYNSNEFMTDDLDLEHGQWSDDD